MQYHNSIVIEKDHAVSLKQLMTLVLMLTTFSIHLPAKTVAEIWKTMPDTIVPYLDPQQRQEMPSYASMHVDGSVDNLLEGKCPYPTQCYQIYTTEITSHIKSGFHRMSC